MIETIVAGDLWEQSLQRIRANLSSQTYEAWFRNLGPLEFDGSTLVLEVPNQFYVDWLDQHYRPLIGNPVAAVAERSIGISFHVRPEPAAPPREFRARAPLPVRDESNLSQNNTFETFIVGSGNQFAHAVCQAVAQSPGERYNPLFIYGGVGLGKTHLMHAIGHQVRAMRPSARVSFVTAEKFMNEMIYSIQHATTLEFKSRYRTADVLLIDDIQFLAGKDSTQEEFFHTFNHLHGGRRQVVISSDRPPRAIATLEQRLTSRFEWGLIVDVQPPDLETRTAILRSRAAAMRPPVPD